MSLTLLAPVLLSAAVPELARQTVRLPNLEALFAAGTISSAYSSAEQWLCAQLGLQASEEPPIAALRLASDTPAQAGTGSVYWMCADPIATTMGIDSVRIDGAIDDLTAPEADALTHSLNEFFARDGLRFVAPVAARWYVECEAPQRIATTPLWRAIGDSMLAQFPTGPDAPAWRARLNEAQMLLHAHPVNAAREENGRARVASLWWWGGGSWPAFGHAAIDAVQGGPRWVATACAASGIDFQPQPADAAAIFQTSMRQTLLILDEDWERSAMTLDLLARWDDGCFSALRAALDAGRLAQATLIFPWAAGTLRVDLKHIRHSRWQRWFGSGRIAGTRPLAETLKAFGP